MQSNRPSARPYIRTPRIAPDGRQIAFMYAADIWLVPIDGGTAERLTAHPAAHFNPRWSRDGTLLAFNSNRTGTGDIYVLPLRGGDVRRVTYHEMVSNVEDWSADGEQIYFSSSRAQQGSALYRIAANGGTPICWVGQPYERLGDLSVSPDGERLVFSVQRDLWWRRGPNPYGGADIWVVSNAPDADDFRKLSTAPGQNRWPMWAPDDLGFYFVSDRDGIENIWYQDLEGGPARMLTSFVEGRVLWPSISADGRTIVFERDFGIWRLDTHSGAVSPISVNVRADTKNTPVRVQNYTRELSELALAPDGKKVAFVVRGEVFADFADKETDKEQRYGASFRVTSTSARERNIAWSPGSRKLVYVSDRHGDEEVYVYDFVTRTETRLTNAEKRKGAPRYSPNGAWIAYTLGDDEIRLINTETNEDRAFVRANLTYNTDFAWSPDGRWLVFSAHDNNFFSNLYVQRIDETEPRQITFLSNLQADRPLWAANGQFIVFTTGQYRAEAQIARVDLRPIAPFFREAEFEKLFEERGTRSDERAPKQEEREQTGETETPAAPEQPAKSATPPASTGGTSELAIVFSGIEQRLKLLTPITMDASAECISPDSRDMIFSATVAGKPNLWTLPLDELRSDQSPRQLTSNASNKWAVQFAPDGKSFYFLESGQVVTRKFPNGDQTTLQINAEVMINFNQEKRQIFDECWRLLRDQFYDPAFRGLDWSAAREQFAPLAAGAQTTGDLHAIINLMVGELRASHLGITGYGANYWLDGYTGLEFDPVVQQQQGALRVTGIIPESPAALAGDNGGVKIGDYLLAIDGVPLGPESNMDLLLQRTVGRRVHLRVGPHPDSDEGARDVAIRPIPAGAYDRLCYRNWVHRNEAYVHRVSHGRLGYVHIRSMGYDDYQQFLVDLDTEAHGKEGVVVDVRFNGGGHIATFILDVLMRRSVLRSAFRDRPHADAGHLAGNRVLNKPTVLVTNEHSHSNTEMFSEAYRRLGLGRVIGRATGGAVIWTYSQRLLDGFAIRVPRLRVATPEGEDLEGKGRAVDVDVELPLGETARGKDRQLDAAVATLLSQLAV